MEMTCKKNEVRIIVEFDLEEKETLLTRAISFPDGITRLITLKSRVWGWYDEFLSRYPWRSHWFKSGLIRCAEESGKANNWDFDKQLHYSFKCLLTKINAIELERNQSYLD